MRKQLVTILTFIILISANSFAQETKPIDFYGIASNDIEKNMLSMTEELFLAQLKELNPAVTDLRYEGFSNDYFSNLYDFSASKEKGNQIFFSVIKKEDEGKWNLEINLQNTAGSNKKWSKTYDSYYKILMESKTSMNDTLLSLFSKEKKSADSESSIFTLENLAGSWSSDKNINKIVIMRGGRGFIIFKNGASMNISIKLYEAEGVKKVSAIQTSGNNASYYTELDRKTALDYALQAEPLEWNFTIKNSSTLSGTQKTLVIQDGSVIQKEIPAEWKRLNQ